MENNIFDNPASMDSEFSLDELIANAKSSKEKEIEKTENNTVDSDVKSEELTPLQKLKLEKEQNGGNGLVVSNKELEEGTAKIPSSDMINTPERMEQWKKAIDEQDDLKAKRGLVTMVHQPKTQFEFMNMIEEINSVKVDESGNAYFDYTNFEGVKATPYFVKIRQAGDAAFDEKSINLDNPDAAKAQESNVNTESKVETNKSPVMSTTDDEKKNIVQVLIDKTGYGIDFTFTEEEKKKIEESDLIRINHVKKIDINSIRNKRSNRSFQDVIKEQGIGGSKSTICFPASGFRAQMKGLTYGEYSDIALSMDNVTFDQYYKRLSIIYNKMVNVSTGPFKDFEDFLKHFAYTDIYLALYAMFVATEPENQEILLKCGNKECNKTFNWKYSTRSILRLDRCSKNFLEKMKEIATSDPIDYDAIRERSAVNNSQLIELPDSGFVVEMGVASAYDFLYNFIPLLNEDTFKEAFGDDVTDIYMNNIILLTSVRSVYVPDGNGEYVECTGYKDILDAIYNVSPSEIQILSAYTVKIQGAYESLFAFTNVKCPHCGNVTESLEISIDELVFQTYQQLMNSSVDPETIPNF